ncbi:MAG: MoxR family ATPase, partial [Elusimicrobia bacterium]|nr:MoxR family ATPase [Elusimicrobiota bacterium]
TQNPIEQEGTYPLPEAQLDRFFLQIAIGYPSAEEERRIVVETTGENEVSLEKVLNARDVLDLQRVVRRVPVPPSTVELAVRLARATRPESCDPSSEAGSAVKKWISWGAGPRASQSLIVGAKARALLSGRFAVSDEDVFQIAKPILRHRLVLNFQAEADGIRPDDIIDRLLHAVRE